MEVAEEGPQRRASQYLLAAKVHREHAAVSIACIAKLAQKLVLLVVAQPRICHPCTHLHTATTLRKA